MDADDDAPLVRVLAGNSVTSTTIYACLNTVDAQHLRRLHPAVACAVAAIPWCDTDTPVVDVVRWRAGLPAAVGARLAGRAVEILLASEAAAAALRGMTHLDMRKCAEVTDDLLLRLPTSLRVLSVRGCYKLTAAASFAHLTALTSLDISNISDLQSQSPREHLQQLLQAHRHRQHRVLPADWSAPLASLPPTLEELHAGRCKKLPSAASFAHLTALRVLRVVGTNINDVSLASLPPSLVSLDVNDCGDLTSAAALPHLPALRVLDVSDTRIGNALVASLPASLTELRLAGCYSVTADATLDHLCALRVLHCIDTELAPTELDACRARGCVVPAACLLRGHLESVVALVHLGNGWLAGGAYSGGVQLWDMAAGGEAATVLETESEVCALAVLRGGRSLAIGSASWPSQEDSSDGAGCIQVWDVDEDPPTQYTTITCHGSVQALAALDDDRQLAAGCDDGVVRVWDVGTAACVATLAGHTGEVLSLTVLGDGRLASGSHDCTVRLWDVGARTCVGMLGGYMGGGTALAALPDGRLATGSGDGTIRLWDTRPEAAASNSSRAVGTVPEEIVGVLGDVVLALLPLPDGRLACSGSDGWLSHGTVCLLDLPPPAALCE